MKYANISKNTCDYCHNPLTDWDYKYQGKHYCKECLNLLFTFQTCSICGKRKKISNDLRVPICKVCQVKDKPCIRCNRDDYKFGLITKDGPVCKTCAVYFRQFKTCSVCHISYYSVSNRNLLNGESQLLCHRCYNKTLPICSLCQKQRKAHIYDENNRAICKLCATEQNKKCTQCGDIISAGRGNLCQECTYVNTLTKRIKFGVDLLSPIYMARYFEQFGWWLKDRRGSIFAATHIMKYIDYFSQIDSLCEKLGRMPNYKEVVQSFSVAMSRKNLLVTTFLGAIGVLMIDNVIQHEQANKDMIERYLDKFNQGTWEAKVLKCYFEQLQSKTKHKGSIRSIRLALGSATKLLEYKGFFDDKYLTNKILEGYLWKFPGQRHSLVGFINFLRRDYLISLKIHTEVIPKFLSPRISHFHSKNELIDMLRHPIISLSFQTKLIQIAMAYFHRIRLPENFYIVLKDFRQTPKGDTYMHIAGRKFYLTKEIFNMLI